MASLPAGTLAGKTAVVTGATRGIGRSIAQALAGAGADVAVTARTPSELERGAAQITELGVRGLAVPCDATVPEQVERMAQAVADKLGTVTILVNNVGNGESQSFLKHTDELWHRMLAINLTSTYYVTKAFVGSMVEARWGRIINIASIVSQTGVPYVAAYTAAKHGLLGLTRALAAELVKYNITINAVSPGYVDTPMTDASIANIVTRTGRSEAQARETLEKMSPQQRLIEPNEVAAAVVFLAQESSKGITGQTINIDGGMLLH